MTEQGGAVPSWLHESLQQITTRIARQAVPHAILLTGEAGHGKAQLARGIIDALMCTALNADGTACGSCNACQYLAAGTHPDFFEVRPESSEQIRIDQIRQLSNQIMMTKSISRYSCSLITPADRLNRNAANALLKTLEEPPPASVIILLAHQANRLPATIRSRCQRLHVRAQPRAAVIDWLQRQTDQPEDRIEQALLACHQAPLRALEFINDGFLPQFTAFVDDINAIHASEVRPGYAGSELAGRKPGPASVLVAGLCAHGFTQTAASAERSGAVIP